MKSKKSISIFITSLTIILICGGSAFASTSTQSATKRYIVKFKTSGVNGSQVVSNHSGHFRKQYKHINAAVADMTLQSVASLQKDSNVAYIEPDNIVKASATTLTNWGVGDINAPVSWQSGLTGKGVNIAIIDTGAGPHSDLVIAGGTNVISGAATTSFSDDNGHGTHVSGIIAAQGLNGGVEGVAPEASIYAVKALNSTGSGYTSDIIAGIDWAITNKMNIISMSLGSSQSDASLQSAVDTAYSDGLLVVAAAGNDGKASGIGTNTEYPANYSSVIAVGAVDSNNNRASFSSTGSKVEVSAPGVNVESTYLNNGYEAMSGTSMATPFVAGDLALLKQEYPNDTNIQLRQLLDTSIKDLGLAGRDSLYGFGLIVAPTLGTVPVVAPPVVITATPTSSLISGTYTSSQNVVLNDTTTGAIIHYTLDGTTPSISSPIYSAPITISATKTLKAIAVGSDTSAILSLTYTISKPTVIPTPTTNAKTGIYKNSILIRLYDQYTKPLRAYYTIDGSTPTTKSLAYNGYINISSTCTLKVIVVDAQGNMSGVLSVLYTIVKPPNAPVLNIKSGIYSKSQTVTLSDTTVGVTMYYTTNGSTPTAKSTLYTGAITIKTSMLFQVIAIDSAGTTSSVARASYLFF